MATTEMNYVEVGKKEPFVAIIRGQSGSSQYFLDNSVLKRYKYIRLLTAAEFNNLFNVSYATDYIQITSGVTFWVNRSTQTTLSTTQVSIASLNLTDGDYSCTQYQHSSWSGFAVALYDNESDLT